MTAIRTKLRDHEQKEIEFDLPVEEVAYALDISTEELLEAVEEDKIGYRKVTDQDGNLVVQVEAYARHCTVTVVAKSGF